MNIDYGNIAALSVCIVGLTQLAKGFIGREVKDRLALLLTLIVGAAVCTLYFVFNSRWGIICTVLLSLSGAGIFYDTIYKAFRRVFEGIGKDGAA